MKKEEFDNKKFKESMGYKSQPIVPFDYQKYLDINHKLTISIYEYCRINKCLWKIKCGKRIQVYFSTEILEEAWWLKFNPNSRDCLVLNKSSSLRCDAEKI